MHSESSIIKIYRGPPVFKPKEMDGIDLVLQASLMCTGNMSGSSDLTAPDDTEVKSQKRKLSLDDSTLELGSDSVIKKSTDPALNTTSMEPTDGARKIGPASLGSFGVKTDCDTTTADTMAATDIGQDSRLHTEIEGSTESENNFQESGRAQLKDANLKKSPIANLSEEGPIAF